MTDFDTSAGLGGGAILRLTVTQASQSVGLNQSTDAWSLTLIAGSYPSYDLTNTITWSATINGATSSGTFSFDFRSTSSQLLGSGSTTVTHNADGTKTISVSGTMGNTGSGTGGPATTSGSFAQTTIASAIPTGAIVSRVSHTLNVPQEYLALGTTEAQLFAAVQATTSEIVLGPLPATLSTAPVAAAAFTNVLDALNTLVRTEQGAIFAATSGTLLAPVQTLVVRERTRPPNVLYTFDASTEIGNVPAFVRDLANVVSSFTATGPTGSATYKDATLTARAGSANASETVLNTVNSDLLAYAQDRLIRGKNVNLRVASIVVDALTTVSDRSADLLGMVPGDRIRVNNLPPTTLGFSSWDGWVLGVTETHRGGLNAQARFEIFVQPVLPATAIFDTNRFMADGALSLFAAMLSTDTTMQVTTSIATTLLETVTFPYTLVVDSEQVTVTACTIAPQVATITRGQNGTTPALHLAGALVDVAAPSLYAF